MLELGITLHGQINTGRPLGVSENQGGPSYSRGVWVGPVIPTEVTGSIWLPTWGIREPEWDKLPGDMWVGLRLGLILTRATGSNWWAELPGCV